MAAATEFRLTLNRDILQRALSVVGPVVPAKSPKPILTFVKLSSVGDTVRLTATNLEIFIVHEIAGLFAEESFDIVLPYARFRQILDSTREQEIVLEVDDDRLVISGRQFSFKLPSDDPAAFPDMPTVRSDVSLTMQAPLLRKAIGRTSYATDPESTRYALGGVCLSLDKGKRAFVATDGRRLSLQSIECEETGQTEIQPVIPTRALKLIDRILQEGEVKLAWDSNLLTLEYLGTMVATRLVEGRYPRWQEVFPNGEGTKVYIQAGDLLAATEQARITTSEESRGVDFVFGDVLTLQANASDVGSSKVETPIERVGPVADSTYDARYVVESLRALDPGTRLEVCVIDHKNPTVIKTEDGDHQLVIMPITRDRS